MVPEGEHLTDVWKKCLYKVDINFLIFFFLPAQLRRSRVRANPSDDADGSSDSDLDEFCPSPGPSVDAALAHAAAAGRYTPRSGFGTSSGLFSGLSKGMSLDLNTDDGKA